MASTSSATSSSTSSPRCPGAPVKRAKRAHEAEAKPEAEAMPRGHTLVLFVVLTPFDLGEFVTSAVIPPAAQTKEFERLCDLLDGEMPGESGDNPEECHEIQLAAGELHEMCKPFSDRGASSGVCLPPGVAVTRVVTVSYHDSTLAW